MVGPGLGDGMGKTYKKLGLGLHYNLMEIEELPEPNHEDGYSLNYLEQILGPEKFKEFREWIGGETCGYDETTGQL
jgi:hypothetical protein